MKRIVTHLLVAAGLVVGACGVAQAHTSLNIGLSLGAPTPVYAAPQPVYYGYGDGGGNGYYGHPGWDRYDHRWDHRDRGDHRWGHSDWNHGEQGRGGGWRG
jgi:hypothetical protein